MSKVLIVGAGLAGATLARVLAEGGHSVRVIDKRSHIAGNCYDYFEDDGTLVHKYGPHILHGYSESVAIKFLSRFTGWTNYTHQVQAKLEDGSLVPLPIQQKTVEKVYGREFKSKEEFNEFIDSIRENREVLSADDVFLNSYGERLTDIFFRPYTNKMWGRPASQIPPGVGTRLKVRETYFTDDFQALPDKGYTGMIGKMLDHPKISVTLNLHFHKSTAQLYDHCFLGMGVDQFFEYSLGRLAYRSLKFHISIKPKHPDQYSPVVNYTDDSPFTRETHWNMFPNSSGAKSLVTVEEPIDSTTELYYPVRDQQSLELYDQYREWSDSLFPNITFYGRIGLYRYLDMVPCVATHLKMAMDYLNA